MAQPHANMAQLQSFRKQTKDGLTSLKLPKEEKVSILKARRNPKIFGAIWKNLVFPEWHKNFEAFGISYILLFGVIFLLIEEISYIGFHRVPKNPKIPRVGTFRVPLAKWITSGWWIQWKKHVKTGTAATPGLQQLFTYQPGCFKLWVRWSLKK